jgi:Zinc knuckle
LYLTNQVFESNEAKRAEKRLTITQSTSENRYEVIREVARKMEADTPSSASTAVSPTQPTISPGSAKIGDISEEIQEITAGHEEFVETDSLEVTIEVATLLRWKQIIDASTNASKPSATTATLQQILKNTEEIKIQLKTPPKPINPTWSQIAAAASPLTQTPSATERKPSQQAEQKRKELKIIIKDEKEREQTRKKDIRQLISAAKTYKPQEATKQIIAARRLPSGDLLFSTLTEKARIELEKSNDWLQAITPSAEIRKTTFPLFVHGVRVKGVNTSDQKQAIKELYEENTLLHPDLEIARVAWPLRIIKENKTYSSLILETSSPETANKIIARGLIHEGEIKTCVRYLSEGRVTRCFNCQKYGHIARNCKEETKCAECAENHATDKCTKGSGEKRKCAICDGNHKAGSPYCSVERKERERAETIRIFAPAQYQFQSSQSAPAVRRVSQTPPPTLTQDLNRNRPQLVASSAISIASRGKGRPTQLTQAARNPSQMRLATPGIGKRKERDFTPPVPPPTASERNRSQSFTPFRNTFETLDNLSDEDADQQ